MGIWDEKVEIQIKMSKPVKYLIIGLLIGGASSFVGAVLSYKFLVQTANEKFIEKVQVQAFKMGYHKADSIYKEAIKGAITDRNPGRNTGETSVNREYIGVENQ